MADEASIVAMLTYLKGNMQQPITKGGQQSIDVSSSLHVAAVMSALTTAGGTAIPMGKVTAPRVAYFANLDDTNYVQVLTAASGTAFLKLNAGEWCIVFLDSGITAPAVLANTLACDFEYVILSV